MRHGNLLSQVTIATDPVYLTEPYIRSQEFVLMERGNTNWLYNCEYVMEVPKDKNEVPHYLPGQNPLMGEFGAQARDARRRACAAAPRRCCRSGSRAPSRRHRPSAKRQRRLLARASAVEARRWRGAAVHVQGNVHMIVGAGANIAVQVGEDGVLVVDTGGAGTSDKVLAAIKQLAPGKEIRWIVNTTFRPITPAATSRSRRPAAPSTATSRPSSRTRTRGADDQGRRARRRAAVQHLLRSGRATFPFNGEPVILYHDESTSTDTDTMVMFRRSDVIAAGDVFSTDSYPGDRPGQRRQHRRHHRRAQPHPGPDGAEQDARRRAAPTSFRATAASATSTTS